MSNEKRPPAPLPPSEIERLAGVAKQAFYDMPPPPCGTDRWAAAVSAVLADPGVVAAAYSRGVSAGKREALNYTEDERLRYTAHASYAEGYEDGRSAGRAAGLEEGAGICDGIANQHRGGAGERLAVWAAELCATTLRARAGKGE